ncbi:MAG TPA: hypothetical protein VEA99_21085, partial [Gemmatimonadaceae bacterium]|nr:hypothetical protein [Gemmatimonadaceae bacterium]
MMLKSNTAVSYPKFKKLGDSVTGVFVSYEENVPSKFGNENLLTLDGDEAKLIIRTPTNLSRTLRQNLPCLPGKRLTVTYTGDAPSKKGNPVKLFAVNAEEVQRGAPVVPTAAANSPDPWLAEVPPTAS